MNKIDMKEWNDNPFKAVGDDWMLITAGTMDKWNTMTASWGTMGILWGKQVAFCFVRPTRHTYGFMEESDTFTLSFFPDGYRDALNYCGSHSGRDVDKAAETGLKPIDFDGGVSFEQARVVLVCKKIYFDDFDPAKFLDPSIEGCYPKKDYHRLYIGEITAAYEA